MAIPNNPSVGDKYTNDNTGVTYQWDGERWFVISTEAADNAATYVKKTGDTMSGDLKFSGTDTISVLKSETLRLKSSTSEETSGFGTNTHITIGRDNDNGSPTTNIYHLQYPEQPAWGANKEYVDDRESELQGQIDDGIETQQKSLVI